MALIWERARISHTIPLNSLCMDYGSQNTSQRVIITEIYLFCILLALADVVRVRLVYGVRELMHDCRTRDVNGDTGEVSAPLLARIILGWCAGNASCVARTRSPSFLGPPPRPVWSTTRSDRHSRMSIYRQQQLRATARSPRRVAHRR